MENKNENTKEKKYLVDYYGEATSILQAIALKILDYVISRNSEFVESVQETKTRISRGNRILITMKKNIADLQKRLTNWTHVSFHQKRSKNVEVINAFTFLTDMHSKNVFSIRENIRNNRLRIGSETNNPDKEVIENLCDNYFYRLNELNNLMSPYIDKDPVIDRVYPFKSSDSSNERNKILNWIKNLKRIIG